MHCATLPASVTREPIYWLNKSIGSAECFVEKEKKGENKSVRLVTDSRSSEQCMIISKKKKKRYINLRATRVGFGVTRDLKYVSAGSGDGSAIVAEGKSRF